MPGFGRIICSNNNGYEPIGEPFYQFLQKSVSDEGHYKIYGYKKDMGKLWTYHVLGILLLGFPYLFFNLLPKYCGAKYQKCNLRIAEFLLISSGHGNYFLTQVRKKSVVVPKLGPTEVRYFEFQHDKYIWIPNEYAFSSLENFIQSDSLDEILDNTQGLSEVQYKNLYELYGPNKITIEIKSYWRLFVEEIFNPFYIFQMFSIVLWCVDDYVLYAGCVLFLTLFSSITALIQTRKQSVALHNLVEESNCHNVGVIRYSFFSKSVLHIDPSELVPGDLIAIPPAGIFMPCDAVLITGTCIVNESMVTGESVPVTKTPPHSSSELYDPNLHKRHTLFCGTHVIQTRYFGDEYVLARVVRTGFYTSKGSLIKSILFPTPVGLKFYKDSLKFVLVLFMLAAVGMAYIMYMYSMRHAHLKTMIIRALDVITIAVPAALPAAMTIGIVYSQNRLKKQKIFCISSLRINVCGRINLACFDKTGTLTHDGLDFDSVVVCDDAKFQEPLEDLSRLSANSVLLQAMASCHSLTKIEGELSGDPLDLTMFESTKWELEEPEVPENTRYDMLFPTIVKPRLESSFGGGDSDIIPFEIGIIRQFPFSSTQQCMSVICRLLGARNMVVFTKGAPERVWGMCKSETVPENFAQRLSTYTAQGFRVIALAYKPLGKEVKWKDAQKIKRDLIESDLIFAGLLVMRNGLKEETAGAIRCLHNAKVRTVMITGDNIYTAISVARDCGMVDIDQKVYLIKAEQENGVDMPKITFENVGTTIETDKTVLNFDFSQYHFALDGRTWSKLRTFYPELIDKLIVRATIFGRFQPDQKTQLITCLQNIDYVVSMVGDGANDCGALKAAHVGVSLSQAEASVAAPFTSQIPDISCIVRLILEGRCALITSFAVFKYISLYSLIQFCTILILYKHYSILGDYQFLFIDLIITTSLAVTMGLQGPSDKLVPKRPMGSLVAKRNLLPLLMQIFLCGFFQIAALYYLFVQGWFHPLQPGKEEIVICWENTVLFFVSCFQYIILACVYSKGRPYRKMLITNFWFLVSALVLVSFLVWMLICPPKILAEILEIIYLEPKDPRSKFIFRYELLLFPLGHFLISVFIESCMADRDWFKSVIKFVFCKGPSKKQYKIMLRETDNLNWFDDIVNR